MPEIKINGKTLPCEKKGANLREVLIKHKMSPHNGNARYLNCFGLGTCGTCAVTIEGDFSPLNAIEKNPPESPASSITTWLAPCLSDCGKPRHHRK